MEQEDKKLNEERKKNLDKLQGYYDQRNQQLDAFEKKLQVNKLKRRAFHSDLTKAVEESKKRIEGSKETSRELERLQMQAEDQAKKVAALCAAWSNFKKSEQNSAHHAEVIAKPVQKSVVLPRYLISNPLLSASKGFSEKEEPRN